MTMSDHKTALDKCTACGAPLDVATSFSQPEPPVPGDATICIMCEHLMVFGDDMKLRDPTEAEYEKLAGNAQIAEIRRARKKVLPSKQMAEDLKKHVVDRLGRWNVETLGIFKAADIEEDEYLPFMASILFKAFSAIVAMTDIEPRSLWKMMLEDLRETRADYVKFTEQQEGKRS